MLVIGGFRRSQVKDNANFQQLQLSQPLDTEGNHLLLERMRREQGGRLGITEARGIIVV